MALFSTSRYSILKSVEIYTAEGISLGQLELNKYRILTRNNKPRKHVYITHFDLPLNTKNGWFEAIITMKNGTKFNSKDYVLHEILPRAQAVQPNDSSDSITLPEKLIWKPVPGARHYQIYIRDLWDDEKLIYTSRLLSTTELELPKDLLKPGGLYAWKIHARDVNEHFYLGDFNNGSNS